MSSVKKNKLSLTKKRQEKGIPSGGSTPTILSMFKKQREKQNVGADSIDTEPGSETDVVITKVVKSKSGTVMLNNGAGSEDCADTSNKDDADKKYKDSATKLSKKTGNISLKKGKLKKRRSSASKEVKDTDRESDKELVLDNNEEKDINRTSDLDLGDELVSQNEKRRVSTSTSRRRSLDDDVVIVDKSSARESRKRKLTLKISRTESEVLTKRHKTDAVRGNDEDSTPEVTSNRLPAVREHNLSDVRKRKEHKISELTTESDENSLQDGNENLKITSTKKKPQVENDSKNEEKAANKDDSKPIPAKKLKLGSAKENTNTSKSEVKSVFTKQGKTQTDTSDSKTEHRSANIAKVKANGSKTVKGKQETSDSKTEQKSANIAKVSGSKTVKGMQETSDSKAEHRSTNIAKVKASSSKTLTRKQETSDSKGEHKSTNIAKASGSKTVTGMQETSDSKAEHRSTNIAKAGGSKHVKGKQETSDLKAEHANIARPMNVTAGDTVDVGDDGDIGKASDSRPINVTPGDTVGVLDDGEGDPEDTETVYRVPYYLENFHTVLDSVLKDADYARLFDSSDMGYITAFRDMSEPCQKLYVRIFGRKLSWLPMVRLKYPEISDDIEGLVEELTTAGFLKSGEELADLPVVLKLLSAPDLKSLAKSFHMNTTSITKPKLVESLIKKSQQCSIGSMFAGGKSASTLNAMLKRARTYVGKVTRLEEEVRAVFIRLLMLFCLYNTNFDEENGSVGQNQLFQMLMVNIGKVTYPSYTVNKKQPVFKDREAVVRFETALQFEMDLLHLIERSKWSDAHQLYVKAREVGVPILKNKQYRKWDSNLPEFLRLYTAGCIYVRIANQGVEILQRQKKYPEAVALLEELLAQKLYCNQYRGHWYERLALNLDAHLKKPAQSLDVINRGLSDDQVRSGRKLAIYERAKKICEAPKSKFSDRMKEFVHDPVMPTPETTIEGMVMSDATSMGMKYQFVMQGDSDSVTLCAVEELVLEHYKNHGFTEGLHAEGSIIANLFTLYFWDILYMDVEDVFQGPFQSCPLDLYTREFYKHRQQAVDYRLEWIRNATEQDLLDEIKRVWEEHSGKMCIGLSWDRFTGPETHQGLVSCMNGAMIAGILERYVKDPRHTRSGFPDLTLWNTETKTIKISEVKGPTDHLSYKQILWIDHLLKLGIDAEVSYVKAVSSKKLKPK